MALASIGKSSSQTLMTWRLLSGDHLVGHVVNFADDTFHGVRSRDIFYYY